MSIILLLRYIKGYVEIKVYNGFIERFINLCTREKVKNTNRTVLLQKSAVRI